MKDDFSPDSITAPLPPPLPPPDDDDDGNAPYALMTFSTNLSCSPYPVPTTTTSVPFTFDSTDATSSTVNDDNVSDVPYRGLPREFPIDDVWYAVS